jgi:hypothetical protein
MLHTVNDCFFVNLPKFSDHRGQLSVLEEGTNMPLSFERLYFVYDVDELTPRGEHAHRSLKQLFFAFGGSYVLTLNDGTSERKVIIDEPSQPFFVVPGLWRKLNKFSSKTTVCAVVCDQKYDESDYIRNFDEFLSFRKIHR